MNAPCPKAEALGFASTKEPDSDVWTVVCCAQVLKVKLAGHDSESDTWQAVCPRCHSLLEVIRTFDDCPKRDKQGRCRHLPPRVPSRSEAGRDG